MFTCRTDQLTLAPSVQISGQLQAYMPPAILGENPFSRACLPPTLTGKNPFSAMISMLATDLVESTENTF
jgi:hypothetical protein